MQRPLRRAGNQDPARSHPSRSSKQLSRQGLGVLLLVSAGLLTALGCGGGIEIPASEGAHFNAASEAYVRGAYGNARTLFRAYRKTYTGTDRAKEAELREGLADLRLGRFGNARERLQNTAQSPGEPERAVRAHLGLATLYTKTGDPARARAIYTTLLNEYPSHCDAQEIQRLRNALSIPSSSK